MGLYISEKTPDGRYYWSVSTENECVKRSFTAILLILVGNKQPDFLRKSIFLKLSLEELIHRNNTCTQLHVSSYWQRTPGEENGNFVMKHLDFVSVTTQGTKHVGKQLFMNSASIKSKLSLKRH